MDLKPNRQLAPCGLTVRAKRTLDSAAVPGPCGGAHQRRSVCHRQMVRAFHVLCAPGWSWRSLIFRALRPEWLCLSRGFDRLLAKHILDAAMALLQAPVRWGHKCIACLELRLTKRRHWCCNTATPGVPPGICRTAVHGGAGGNDAARPAVAGNARACGGVAQPRAARPGGRRHPPRALPRSAGRQAYAAGIAAPYVLARP